MLIDEPAVLVPRRLAQPLLELAVAEAQRRRQRGRELSDDMKQILGELARAARHDPEFPTVSDPGSDHFRRRIVEGVTTSSAAAQLGISDRAVRYRCANGQLAAEQQPDGTWLIDPKAIPA